MNSLILRTTNTFLVSLLLLASLFLLIRGHNAPGGGFAGGLMAAAAFILSAIAIGPAEARRWLRLPPVLFIPIGLSVALLSALWAFLAGDPFFAGQWVSFDVAGREAVKLGTPLLFDIGVYLTVIGIGLSIILPLMEEE